MTMIIPMTDSARQYLSDRAYPRHVIDGGLEFLLSGWERVCESVARGEVQYRDDYLNDMDGRQILAEMRSHLDAEQVREADVRIAKADAKIRANLVPTKTCIWGDENARKSGFVPGRNWWYYHRPRVVESGWRDQWSGGEN
jgi:hypothetical protein